jgi:cyclohexanone monooxygenase
MLYGPNTNQGGNSIILILEAQAHFVAAAIRAVCKGTASSVEVRPDAMRRYLHDLESALAGTVWNGGCDSYFRSPGGEIVTQLPHTAGWYREQTRLFSTDDFEVRSGASRP